MNDLPHHFTRKEFDEALIAAYKDGASDITLQPGSPMMCEVHGRLVRSTERPLDQNDLREAISILYGENGHALMCSGADIDGRYDIAVSRTERLGFRVNVTGGYVPGGSGYQITLRTIPGLPPRIEEMGIETDSAIMAHMHPDQGIILVVGVTGSGKSTLIASMIRHKLENVPDRKIITFESPIEFTYTGLAMGSSFIWQTEVGNHLLPRHGESEFAYAIRNALRRAPSDIFVGEARDRDTIQSMIEASLTGHTTLSTLHADSVPRMFSRIILKFPEEARPGIAYDLAGMLRLAIAQTLPSSTDGKRVAAREYLVFDRQLRERLQSMSYEKIPLFLTGVLKERGNSMLHAAERLFAAGRIDEQVMARYRLEYGEQKYAVA